MDEEHWRPFEGRYSDGLPLIGAVSRLSASERQRYDFPWCIHLTVHFDNEDERGYPSPAENASVEEFSGAVLAQLRVVSDVIEAARLTGHGAREFWWYVREPDPMHDLLTALAAQPQLYRAFDYDIVLDADWNVLDRFSPRTRVVLLLGIETSCDDTATAVVRDGHRVLSNVSTNQDEFHAKYGGIVPEIASRRHASLLSAAVDDALARAGSSLDAIDGIAVTAGPGLIGSLVVGVATAKALAFATGKPLYGVNHLHGHLFAAFLDTDVAPPYPFLALLVSGGHSQLIAVESARHLRVIATTRDDAAGEAFDKTARLLGLPFPGGPALEQLARQGDPKAVAFPRYRPEPGALDMSFSGLKTSARYFLASDAAQRVSPADVAASFQAAIVDVLIDRVERALEEHAFQAIVLSGGVAANMALATAFRLVGETHGLPAYVPERRFCTDNAAMIAAAADRRGNLDRRDPLTLTANPNLPF